MKLTFLGAATIVGTVVLVLLVINLFAKHKEPGTPDESRGPSSV